MSIASNNYTCPEELIGVATYVVMRLKNMNLNELKILSHAHLDEYLGPHKYKKTQLEKYMKNNVESLFNKELTIDNQIKIMEGIYLMYVFQPHTHKDRPKIGKMCMYYKFAKERHEQNANNISIAHAVSIATSVGMNEQSELPITLATHVENTSASAKRIGGKKTKRRRRRYLTACAGRRQTRK
jgi:hypothetical protein